MTRPRVEIGQVWVAYSKNLRPGRKITITALQYPTVEYRLAKSHAKGVMLLESLYKDYRLAGTTAKVNTPTPTTLPTRIVVLLDRSGSMGRIRADMEGAFNNFIREQAAIPGECLVSLYQFDGYCENVYVSRPIDQVPPLVLVPRGWTALYDAMGTALNATMVEGGPRTLFVVITDGEENSSRYHSQWSIQRLVKRAQETCNFEFVFFGANQDAVFTAQTLGIYGNTITFDANAGGTMAINNMISTATTAYRGGASGQSLGITQTSYNALVGDDNNS